MKVKCIECGSFFHISKVEAELIEEGLIKDVDINICEDCKEHQLQLFQEVEESNFNVKFY